jgi:NADH-quinone oxidoreductase subunit N
MILYLIVLCKCLIVVLSVLIAIAYLTAVERKVMGSMQRRLGPSSVGFYGTLQPFADALKLFLKEVILPVFSNRNLFLAAPLVTLALSFMGWAVIPFGKGVVISTLAFKVGSAPFHFWVPDVYSKVSLFVNFYLISVPKIGILFTLIKFLTFFPITGNLILIFSILSLLTGAIGGLLQQKITRLLAYSSISHVGYILLALYGTVRGTPYSSFSPENFLVSEVNKGLLDSGIGNGISPLHIYCIALYLIIYSFMTIGVFSVLYTLRSVYTPLTKESYIFISSLKNLSKIAPFLSGSLAVIVLSMAGVPPLAGFVAKLSVYLSVLDNNGVVISVFAVLCSVVTAVYYLRIIKVSYFYNTETGVTFPAPVISEFSALVISFSTLILIFYPFLNPSILYLAFTGA